MYSPVGQNNKIKHNLFIELGSIVLRKLTYI